MNKLKTLLLTLLISLGLSSFSYAGFLDSWTDEQVCRLMKNPSHPESVTDEVKKRGISCEGGVATKSTLSVPKASSKKSKSSIQKQTSNNTGKWNTPGPLDQLTIPDNWELFKNKQALGYARKKFGSLISPRLPKERLCLELLKDWGKSMEFEASATGQKQGDASSAFGANMAFIPTMHSCPDNFIYSTQVLPGTPDYMKEILLHWAKTDAVFIPNRGAVDGSTLSTYIYIAVQSCSAFVSYYAKFYDEFNYSDSERRIVDSYIADKLLNINTRNRLYFDNSLCDPDDLEWTIEGQYNGSVSGDTCGSSVWKTTLAQLLVGLRLNNKALFKKGVENTKWQLSFFDDTGIFATWAIKGASAFQYSASVPIMLGGLTEIYASLGYDFMEHKLRNGLSVKQLMDRQYELFVNPHILDSWVKRYKNDYKGTSNSEYINSSAEQIRGNDSTLFGFVRNLPRYIDTYRDDIGNSQEFDAKLPKQPMEVIDNVVFMSLGNFQPLDPYLVYISDITEPEAEINWDEGDALKGEYVAKWYIGNAFNKPIRFEYRGKDTLTLDRGKGTFSGNGYSHPSSKERANRLLIEYKPNGKITVEGGLGIFPDAPILPTFLKGDISKGLISGTWEQGDLIKVEITKVNN